jgi:MYXO-CTERM domain-containing protein
MGETFMRFALRLALCALAAAITTSQAFAAISWDGQSNTNWWFDPVNWSPNPVGDTAPHFNPPSSDGLTPTDTNINNGWNTISTSPGFSTGEGVVFDPDNDPFYAAAAGPDFDYPSEDNPAFDRDTIWRLYITTSNATVDNKLTIKSGSLETVNTGANSGGNVQLGRGGATPGLKGTIVQTGGSFKVTGDNLDIGNFNTSAGNGFYEYHGGILEAGLGSASTHGIRLAPGGSAGSGKSGYIGIHNDDAPGRIRTWNFNVAAHMDATFGTTNSSGTVEFFANSAGTRPVQVMNNLTINNESHASGGKRSAVLKLSLDEAPTLLGGGVPINMGLFAVTNLINGVGATFYSDTIDNLGTAYSEGSTISATIGSNVYNWTISYTGNITFSNADNSVISSITGAGTGNDVVLIGLSSVVSGTPGDFDSDGDVDGRDFLVWQRNTSIGNLSDWQANYGATGPLTATTAVPEPTSALLGLAGLVAVSAIRRRS